MPLQTSGPLSLGNIQTQFGGVSPTGLGEYYSGGTRVPAGTSGINGVIPSSGTIKVSDFYGAPLNPVITCAATYSGFIPPMGIGAGQAVSGYNAAGYGNTAYGSISTNQIQGRTIVTVISTAVTPPKAGGAITNYLIFGVAGNQTAWTWTSLQVPDGTVYTRAGSASGAYYDTTNNFTRWFWDTSSFGAENLCGTITII